VIVLMVLRGRTSKTGLAILGCCFASVVWASATAISGGLPVAFLAVLDSIRLSAWLLFAVALVTLWAGDGSGIGRGYLVGALAFCLATIAYDGWLLVLAPDASRLYTPQLLVRIGFGVAGLLTIENLWRNTEPQRRWHVWPLCLAVGGLFAYELFLFSDAFITRGRVNPGLNLGRPIVAAFMAPSLALAMARNREWRIDIHVSRQVVLHTATLLASGCVPARRGRGRHVVARIWRRLGTRAAAGDALRQHCRPHDRALLRECTPTPQVSDFTKLFYSSL
jgi:hypothetical protein